MFGITFFPIYGIVIGVNLKDDYLQDAFEDQEKYIVVQILLLVFGITIFYYARDINKET
jgi:hypothetical protein